MTFSATIYKVLVASPSDTQEFRDIVSRALLQWNDLNAEGYGAVLLPVMWEMSATPAIGGSPQSIVNKQIVDPTDVVVAVFWTRLGTPTENAPSGSVEEIQRKVSQGAPVMLYFSRQPADPLTVDPNQLRALQDFKSEMEKTALLGYFETGEELLRIVQRDITRTIRSVQPPQEDVEFQPASDLPEPTNRASNEPLRIQRVLDSYKSQLCGILARRQAQFDGATPDYDAEGARYAMTGYSEDLRQLVGAVAGLSPEAAASPLMGNLIDMSTRASQLGRLRMSLDGGQSWLRLTEGAQSLFSECSELLGRDWLELARTAPDAKTIEA